MSLKIEFQAETPDELHAKINAYMTSVSGVALTVAETSTGKAGKGGRKSSAQEPSEDPKTSSSTGKGDSATKRAVGSTATVVEPEVDPEPEENGDDDVLGASDPEWTIDDVRKILVELKNTFPNENGIVAKTVETYGGVKKLADVPTEKYAAIIDQAKKLLAKGGK